MTSFTGHCYAAVKLLFYSVSLCSFMGTKAFYSTKDLDSDKVLRRNDMLFFSLSLSLSLWATVPDEKNDAAD